MLQADLAELKKAHALELTQLDITVRRQKAVAEEQISAGQVRAKGLQDILGADEALFAEGIISRLEVAQARADHDRTMLDIANATRAHHRGRGAGRCQARQPGRDRAPEAGADRRAAGGSGAAPGRGQHRLAGQARRSPGRIEEIRVGQGDVVAPGTIIATIGRVAPEAFEVIAVFDNDMAKRIVRGMDVHVRPASVKKEEHGSMRGRVLSITELGMSKAELNAILRNPQLTDSLMGDVRAPAGQDRGVPRQGHAQRLRLVGRPRPALFGDARHPCRGRRHRRARAPIALIIPALRHLLGLEG